MQLAASLLLRLASRLCSGCDDEGETARSIGTGGAATEKPLCNGPNADWVPGDFKPFHDEGNRT